MWLLAFLLKFFVLESKEEFVGFVQDLRAELDMMILVDYKSNHRPTFLDFSLASPLQNQTLQALVWLL